MKRTALLCVISAAVGCLLAVGIYRPYGTEPRTVAQESGRWSPGGLATGPPTGNGAVPPEGPSIDDDLTPEERINVAVYENANRSAVNIFTKTVKVDFFFGRELRSESEGSGTVIDQQGHILTNLHVIQGAGTVQVTLYNGRTFPAKLVGFDVATDLAVLKIDAPSEWLHPVTFGSSTGLKVGQRVFAIGNPFGLERTLSTGVISSLNRSLPRRRGGGTMKSIIQIDAAINPGSSGGPLLDTHSRMIGMNTAIASKTGESAGVGFAIPVNTILRIVPHLIEDGRVIRAEIGIARVSAAEQGLRIFALVPEGPAHKAGLQGPKIVRRQGPVYQTQTIDLSAADVIVAIDDQPVRTVDDLLDSIESKSPGDEMVVTVIRENKQKRIVVRLEAEE